MTSSASSAEDSLRKLLQSYTNKPKRGSLNAAELTTSLLAVSEEKRLPILKTKFRGGKTILHRSAMRGNIVLLGCLMSNVSPELQWEFLMMQDDDGETSLHSASMLGTADTVKYILDYTTPENRQASLMMKGDTGKTLLDCACNSGSVDTVKYILDSIALGNRQELLVMQDKYGVTLLHRASLSGSADTVKYILDYITPETRQEVLVMQRSNGETPLSCAITAGSVDAVKCIIDYTAPENRQTLLMIQDKSGWTSLHCASASRGSVDIIKCVLDYTTPEKKQELLMMKDEGGWTPLHCATMYGSADQVKYLLYSTASENRQKLLMMDDNKQKTSLHYACEDQPTSTVEYMLDYITPHNIQALLMMKDNDGETLLHFASRLRSAAKMKSILDHAVPETIETLLSMRDKKEKTSLHWASSSGSPETIKYILDNIAPQNRQEFLMIQDSKGMTSLHCAAENTLRAEQTIRSLLQDLTPSHQKQLKDICNNKGLTALDIVLPRGCQAEINLLKDSQHLQSTSVENTSDVTNVDGVASLSISRVDVKPLIATNTKPVGTGYNQGKRTERLSLPTPRTTVVTTDQPQENEDVLDLSKVSTDNSFSPASQFPPISQSNQSNQVVDEPPVRPESTTSVFSEFSSVSGFSSFLKEQSWIEPEFFTLPPAMQHTGQTQLSISETTLQRSDHTPAMTSKNEKTYFPSGQEYTAEASSNPDSNIETPTDQSNQLLSSQTSLQVSRLTLSVRGRNYCDGTALETANSSFLNVNESPTTHSTPSQQTKGSVGHQENEDNSQVSELPINRRFCPPPAQSPLTFQLNVMNQQIDAHNVRPESTRSNLSDFSSVSGVSSLLGGIQLSPVASRHRTFEHFQPSTALGSDHFQSYQPWIKSGFSTFAPAMQHLGQTQLPISETTQQRSNAVLAMTSSKKMASFSFGQERPEVTSSVIDDSIDAPIDQSDQLLSDQTLLQVSRPFFSEIAASDASMPDAGVASDSLQSRTDTSSASTPPFTIPLLPIPHATSPAQQPPTTVTNGSLDQSCRSIPQLYPSSPVLSPTEHLQTTSSSSDLLSTPNSSSTLSSKTSKRTSVPSSTSVSKEAPILPLHHYPASTESYNAESTPTAVGTKRHAPVDRSMETESGPTPPQVSKYTSEVEGETLKLQHNSGRHLFMFSSDGKVEDFTKDVNRITKADCSIKTSDGYTCIDNVALKALPLPFIVCIGNSETTVTSRTGQENAPIASTSSNSGEAAAVENPASRFGRKMERLSMLLSRSLEKIERQQTDLEISTIST